jgi:hypothetical protein
VIASKSSRAGAKDRAVLHRDDRTATGLLRRDLRGTHDATTPIGVKGNEFLLFGAMVFLPSISRFFV